jgi:hypothetical protein
MKMQFLEAGDGIIAFKVRHRRVNYVEARLLGG